MGSLQQIVLDTANEYARAVQDIQDFRRCCKAPESFPQLNFKRITLANRLVAQLQEFYKHEYLAEGLELADADQKARNEISKYLIQPRLLESIPLLLRPKA